MARELIFDLETDGLLPEVSKIWVISLMMIDDDVPSPIYSYIGDEIDDAIGLIEEADVVINIFSQHAIVNVINALHQVKYAGITYKVV